MFAAVCGVILYVYHRADPPASSFSPSTRRNTLASKRSSAISPSSVTVSIAGFNHFENLYLRNGTIFLLSPPGAPAYDPEKGGGGGFKDLFGVDLPPIEHITSTGLASDTPYEVRQATANEIQVIPWEDRALLDLDIHKPLRIDGTTVSPQPSVALLF